MELEVVHTPGWLLRPEAQVLFDTLKLHLPWKPTTQRVDGAVVSTGRLACDFTGLFDLQEALPAHALGPLVLVVLQLVNTLEPPSAFTRVLANMYPDGQAWVDWHSDGLCDSTVLLSLGAARTFSFRSVDGLRGRSFRLASGDLLVIPGAVQPNWEHAVLPEPEAGPRISLSFRVERSGS